MKNDLEIKGPSAVIPRRVAASASRFETGEPLYSTASLTTGVASANTFVLAAADFIQQGTNWFGGVAIKGALPFKTGTLVAQTVPCACPVPYAGRIRGQAETVTSIDTASELLGVIGDVTRIDYNATGASDGGELYTIKETAAQDTDFFAIIEGNTALGWLEVTVDPGAYRIDYDYAT